MAIVTTKLDEPILFRTVKNDVYPHTLSGGSIWLRTNVFYQELEADEPFAASSLHSAASGEFDLRYTVKPVFSGRRPRWLQENHSLLKAGQ